METLLNPGTKIKAHISETGAVNLAKTLYGLDVTSIEQMDGYDDINYRLKVKSVNNPHLSIYQDGYVLKIMNKIDSKKLKLVEAQNEMMLFLGKNKFKVPQPMKNIKGNLYSVEMINEDESVEKSHHVVRLLTFQNGILLKHAKQTSTLYYNIGSYMADFLNTLKKFSYPAYYTNKSIWMLQFVPELRNFLFVVKDDIKKTMVQEIIEEFENNVLTQFENLEKGVIHGDLNESNILIEGDKVEALLDFGDSQYGPYLFEVAVSLCYMILQSQNLHMSKFVLDGFTKKWKLTNLELSLLKVCICARMCQSLILGVYSAQQEPNNEYILSTQKVGWIYLTKLKNMSNAELLNLWGLKVLI